jgi:hypothetical protein
MGGGARVGIGVKVEVGWAGGEGVKRGGGSGVTVGGEKPPAFTVATKLWIDEVATDPGVTVGGEKPPAFAVATKLWMDEAAGPVAVEVGRELTAGPPRHATSPNRRTIQQAINFFLKGDKKAVTPAEVIFDLSRTRPRGMVSSLC